VEVAGLTHPGRVRAENQDHFLVLRAGRFLQTVATSLPAGHVPDEFGDTVYGMAVADGMGGASGGEVASRLALTQFIKFVITTPDWIVPGDEADIDRVLRRTVLRFRNVNAEVVAQASRDPKLAGMATTLTLAWSLGTDLYVAHAGNSRVYLLRQGRLHTLTRDHNVAQKMAEAGTLPGELVAAHRLRHVLTQFLGGQDSQSVPEIQRFTLTDGDRLLLCTDGLIHMVDDATISAELRRDAPAAAICQSLVDLALKNGGRDNVTVIVALYQIAPET
jgi:protein phosphatase